MNIFDIYLAYMSFDEDKGGKERPVLVVDIDDGLAVVYNVTSQYGGKSEYIRSKYYPLKDWKQAGLLKQSYVDTVKARYIEQSVCTKSIGTLTETDKTGLIAFLNR
ncbi:MazF family toxin-antitoxin system [Clostridia bacterium]|nr:MazF family toxin-antitoxin system [Clostridia bacterium]